MSRGAPGARLDEAQRTHFRVWAPERKRIEIHVTAPEDRMIPLQPAGDGYYEAHVAGLAAGTRYLVRLDGKQERPDPASRSQPDGVHGPSELIDTAFDWAGSGWRNVPLPDYVIYELHVGTFSQAGTFDGVIEHLAGLKDLGITAIELMPIAQFPGGRNWGYDGAYPYAAQNSYGGAPGLHRLVDAAHRVGIAVILDVVYNHMGPEGNYLADFGPYFTDRYRTPWGAAINFDGPDSDGVRDFFIQNALYWLREFHIDALRLDAVHAIYDFSAVPVLQELARETAALADERGWPAYLIAESSLNDPRIVRERGEGGYGLHGQWNDEFHHALRVALTGERDGYYVDFTGVPDLVKSLNEAYVYSGQHSSYRKRRFGAPATGLPAERFVVFGQNHDQVGNRMLGERLNSLISFEAAKLAAGSMILSPFLPMLWMGEEYGEIAPFLYFVSHSDDRLIDAVRKGRKHEFETFAWQGEPPDPQSPATFESSKLDHTLKTSPAGQTLLAFHRRLLEIRRKEIRGAAVGDAHARALSDDTLIAHPGKNLLVLLHFDGQPAEVEAELPEGEWSLLLDSTDTAWGGLGSQITRSIPVGHPLKTPVLPWSFAAFKRAG